MTKLVEIDNLRKTYLVGFMRRPVEGARGITFDVREGEIVGLVGPNGAGKTTTIKVLLGLCAPTSGAARIRGIDSRDPRSRERVGFLPENPYVYPYLTPREFVDLCARLSGMSAAARADRVPKVLERTGIAWAADRPVHRLSKGMLQRTGLAAALVGDPELLVLDEPMSGLDPLGRREVRDLIFEERRSGRTVLFSSHVLSDVEALCDRVVILRGGEVVVAGEVSALVHRGATITELTLRCVDPETRARLLDGARLLRELGEDLVLEIEGENRLGDAITLAIAAGGKVVSAVPRKDSLEDLFFREALRTGDGSDAAPARAGD
ncbi:MAG: ABC transporter ATP-binding protein [Deltaproteobacteria bacterium]|nr:ABC transporter ATP-binding protein [Deltaproteobacteria bacterium]